MSAKGAGQVKMDSDEMRLALIRGCMDKLDEARRERDRYKAVYEAALAFVEYRLDADRNGTEYGTEDDKRWQALLDAVAQAGE